MWAPLMYAARDGATEAALALVPLGADVNSEIDGMTLLIEAVINMHFDLAPSSSTRARIRTWPILR
jgi:ankyrin repeat protein